MLRHGPLERELLSRSRSPVFGSRPISPGVMGYEVAAQISQLIADFVTDIHSSTYIDIFLTVGQV